jgi:beta-glucosidase
MKRIFSTLLLVIFLLSACTGTIGNDVPGIPTDEATIVPVSTIAAPAIPTISAVEIYKDATQPVDARVEDLLSRMTIDEKIGQMTQVEKNSIKPGDITKYYIGSILSGGGGSPAENTPAGWTAMVKSFQDEALATRLGIPLVYGVDAVHGHNNLLNATIFPQNIGLGAANDPDLTCKIAKATAEEMLATGVTWDFSPVIAVPQDVRWGRTYEGYSESTDIVTALGPAFVKCMQTPVEGKPGEIGALATAKHYIGDGGTIWGSSRTDRYMLDQGNMQVDEATLRKLYLPPYKAAVDEGAMSIMASFSSWKGLKMHAQKYLLTDVLKDELGFKGFIVSDWQAIDQINEDYYTSVVISINAGVDMNMVPYDYVKFIDIMKKAVAKGDIPQDRVDEAVRRILRAKFELSLFESPMPDTKYQQTIRSADHLALAREAVRKSLVLLKNDNETLPLARDASLIFIAGSGGSNIGMQSGGWTMTWQGEMGPITEGTTVVDAVNAAVSPDTRIVFGKDALFENEVDASGKPRIADVGIVVVGEVPYAEGVGDSATLELQNDDIQAIERMRERAKKVVVVILSGRPVIMTDLLPKVDAWVAAWLPGTEAAGITDVLFGDYPFSGKLPYTWPRSVDQLPLNINNIGNKIGCDAPLFPFGYGLIFGEEMPEIPVCPNK